MATHDYVIANASGAAVRADLNNALAAIVSNNSNATEPATMYAYQWWADTTAGQLKLRNAANDDWIVIQELDGTMLMEDGSAASPGLAFASDLDTGLLRPGANQFAISTAGNQRLVVDASGQVGIGETVPGTLVEINSETPYVTLKNSTQEDTDGGRESKVIFEGEQSGGEITTLAQIDVSHDGTADDQKGKLIFSTNDGADGAAPTAALTIGSDQKVVASGDIQSTSQNGGPLAGFRNVLVNGLFAVDQRGNDGATLSNTNIFTRDRWQSITSGSGGDVTVARSGVNLDEDPNVDGAADGLIYTTTASLSQGASSNLYLSQKIEGRNFRQMCGWVGSDTDRPVTLSFWVKSSVTGTYSISLLRDPTGIAVSNLLTYVADYTVDSPDTWEKKTITITAPNDVGASTTSYVDLSFHVWGGSSRRATSTGWQDAASAVAVVSPNYDANWGSATGQTFEITAVQLEPGPVATPFEHRPLATELALCQRYFFASDGLVVASLPNTSSGSTTRAVSTFRSVPMRTTPTEFIPTPANGTVNSSNPTANTIRIQYTTTNANNQVVLGNTYTADAEL